MMVIISQKTKVEHNLLRDVDNIPKTKVVFLNDQRDHALMNCYIFNFDNYGNRDTKNGGIFYL